MCYGRYRLERYSERYSERCAERFAERSAEGSAELSAKCVMHRRKVLHSLPTQLRKPAEERGEQLGTWMLPFVVADEGVQHGRDVP